jgi:hypothetical protein
MTLMHRATCPHIGTVSKIMKENRSHKRLFQAIGVADLRITIPNGKGTTTILLKDVLHAPDFGLMLVSM